MTLIIICIFALLVIGVPVSAAFALPSILGAGAIDVNPTALAASVPFHTATSFSMLAIPYFLLAGQIMNDGGLMGRMIKLAEAVLGRIKGSLGYVAVAVSAMLGAMTGSSVATVAAVSNALGERMVEAGFKRDYTSALLAASGLLGVLIPPSIPLIIYGSASGVSVSDLFLATLAPGFLAVLLFMLIHRLSLKSALSTKAYAKSGALDSAPRSSGGSGQSGDVPTVEELRTQPLKTIWSAFVGAFPALLMPVILLGGIYSGIFTPTEAAAVAGLYGLVLVVVTRGLKIKQIPNVFLKAALPAAAILAIIAFTGSFNRLLTLEQIPQLIAGFALNLTDNAIVFLLLVNLVLLIVGMFMETNAAVLLMAPLLLPAALEFGIDPIHFGIILVTNIELGLITPPLALNIFVASKITNSSVIRMLPYLLRFILGAVILVLIVTFVPALSLWPF